MDRVEFQDVHRFSDGQVKHSREAFYAGSFWKISVHAFNDEDPQGRRTLGLFIQRPKAEITYHLRKCPGAGLLTTYVALHLMDGHGHPALLYIVPFTVGTLLVLGAMRGELKNLWRRGIPEWPCPHARLQYSQ